MGKKQCGNGGKMQDYNIVYIADEQYAMPTCISILSLKRNRSVSAVYHIYVLSDGISKMSVRKLLSVSEVNFEIRVIETEKGKYKKPGFMPAKGNPHVTAAAVYKFFLAEILTDIDKALYLDGDLLVRKDISKLFEVDLTGRYAAAADDMGDRYDENGRSGMAARIGLPWQNYFNSGVLLLNLHAMRRDRLHERLMRSRLGQENYFMDQDAFNIVMGRKRVCLPYCYNFKTALFDVMDIEEISARYFDGKYTDIQSCIEDQAILHMCGEFKPWQYNIPWVTDLFMDYYRESPYREDKPRLSSPLKALNDRRESMRGHKDEVIARKVWPFPFEKVRKGSRVVLYGAGQAGRDLYKQAAASGFCEIVLWVDKSYRDKEEGIVSPVEIQKEKYDFIVIALSGKSNIEEVERYLLSCGMDGSKFVTID